jgi:hypothetical protein
MVLANGHLITGDLASAAASAAAVFSFWRWLRSPTWGRAILAGLLLGLAQLVKFVCLTLYPVFAGLWLLSLIRRPGRRPAFLQFLALLLLPLFVINLAYGFEGCGKTLVEQHERGQPVPATRPGELDLASGCSSVAASLPIPLPFTYVAGLRAIATAAAAPYRQTYLQGQWAWGGWRDFCIYGFLVKLPLGTWLLIAAATACTVSGRAGNVNAIDEACLLAPMAAFLAAATCGAGVQFFRYALPVYPFLFIWVSKTALLVGTARPPVHRDDAELAQSAGGEHSLAPQRAVVDPLAADDRRPGSRQPAVGVLVLVAVAWSVISSLMVYPHSGSYFNELAGGPFNGHEHFISSEMDWGQDLLYLKRWLDKHPQAKPLHLAYYGSIEPAQAGIEYRPLPPGAPQAGWYALSVSCLRGGCSPTGQRSEYSEFLKLRPTARAGYSIYIYQIRPGHARKAVSLRAAPRPGRAPAPNVVWGN